MLIAIFCYYLSRNINIRDSAYSPNIFNFNKNGFFNITLSNIAEESSYLIQICNEREYNIIIKSQKEPKTCSQLSDLCSRHFMDYPEKSTLSFSGSLSEYEEGEYYSLIVRCDAGFSKYKLDIIMKNQNLKFSKLEYINIFCCILLAIKFGMLIFNFQKAKNFSHFPSICFYAAVIFFFLIYTISVCFNFICGGNMLWEYFNYILLIIYQTSLISIIFSIAKGSGFFSVEYTSMEIYNILIYSLLICICNSLNTVKNRRFFMQILHFIERYNAFFFIIHYLSPFLYFALLKEVYVFINECIDERYLYTIAHVRVISEKGINPMTTPLKTIHENYKKYIYMGLCYFGFKFVLTNLLNTLFSYAWLTILQYFVDLGAIYTIGKLPFFQIKPPKDSGFNSYEEKQFFTKEEVRNIDVLRFISHGSSWDGTTPLPAEPGIVDKISEATPEIFDPDDPESMAI